MLDQHQKLLIFFNQELLIYNYSNYKYAKSNNEPNSKSLKLVAYMISTTCRFI